MANKGLAFLAGALVVLAVPAIVITTKDRSGWESDADPLDGEPVLPELEALGTDGLFALELTDRDGSVRIERDGGRWVLPQLDGYPARDDRVTELVRGLQTLRIEEESTSNPDKHARVGLVAPDDGGEAAALVRVLDAEEEAVCELLLGQVDRSRSADALFVRRPDDDQCWLAAGRVPRSTSTTNWFDTGVVSIDTSSVRRAAIAFEDDPGASYELVREDAEQFGFELRPVPEGREPGAEWQWSALARTLANFSCTDVRRDLDGGLDGARRATATLETYDGAVVEGRLVRVPSEVESVPGATWITFEARVDAERVATDEQLDPGAARAFVDDFTARVGGWWFEVPAGTAAGLWTPLADLLEPLPEETLPGDAAGPVLPNEDGVGGDATDGDATDGEATGGEATGGDDATEDGATGTPAEEPAEEPAEDPNGSAGDEG